MTTKPLGTPLVVIRATDGLIIGIHPLGPSHCVTGFPVEALLSKAVMYKPSEVRELCRRAMQYNDTGPAIEDDWLNDFLKREGLE